MKTFKQYLNEEAADGDCFLVAGRAMMKDEALRLVHAYVYGQGPMEGRRFVHAWNEKGSTCIDNSNGQKTKLPKRQYYKLAGVVKTEGAYVSYDHEEALVNMLKEYHWGPWDLSTMLDERLPDDNSEIGKKKLKIGSKELLQIKKEQ